MKIGDAFDVTVQPTLVADDRRCPRRRTRYSMSYLVRNAKAERGDGGAAPGRLWGRDTKVITESLPSRRIDAYTLGWSVPVAGQRPDHADREVETGW